MKNKWPLLLALIIFPLFIYSGLMLLQYYGASSLEAKQHRELAGIVSGAAAPALSGAAAGSSRDPYLPQLAAYQAVAALNEDFVGWLKIEGTAVDYPVVQTVDNEFYLERNFQREYSKHGTLFLDTRSDLREPGHNLIIHGHHMKDGRMFGALQDYTSQAFYREHPVIRFDTLEVFAEYEIVAVFKVSAADAVQGQFRYHDFVHMANEQAFLDFAANIRRLSLYETQSTVEYGDQLLTLSTCEYTRDDGRLVVVGKRIKEIVLADPASAAAQPSKGQASAP